LGNALLTRYGRYDVLGLFGLVTVFEQRVQLQVVASNMKASTMARSNCTLNQPAAFNVSQYSGIQFLHGENVLLMLLYITLLVEQHALTRGIWYLVSGI
jgi:hypothetical protein